MASKSMFDLLQKALEEHGIATKVMWKPGAYVTACSFSSLNLKTAVEAKEYCQSA